MHDTVTANTTDQVEVLDIGMHTYYRVLIEGVEFVVTGPGIDETNVLKSVHAARQARSDNFLKQIVVHVQVVGVWVLIGVGRSNSQEPSIGGPGEDASVRHRGVDQTWIAGRS